MSRCRMIALGGDPRWIGWDSNSELAASQFDLIHQFAAGEKFMEADKFPRPGQSAGRSDEPAELFAPTIADFNVGAFMQRVHS